MFQYAFASILAKKNNGKLFLDKTIIKKEDATITKRNFELDIFKISYNEFNIQDLSNFEKLSKTNRIRKKFGFSYPKKFIEKSFKFNHKNLLLKAPIYLIGFFQSYKYFEGFNDFVKSLFTFNTHIIDDNNLEFLNQIKSVTSISIHIRRGDYINNNQVNNIHGICDDKYYLNSINYMSSKYKNCVFFFFSDDINWVKEKFEKLPFQKFFVTSNLEANSWIDMFLMKNCKHNIIANSSFSFWGAWLNENEGKTIIAPKKWFADLEKQKESIDLIPKSWIRL